MQQSVFHLKKFFAKMPPLLANLEKERLVVKRVYREGKRKIIDVQKKGEVGDLRQADCVRVAAEELYWNDLLTVEMSPLKNLTIRMIISAWDLLSSLADVCLENLPKYEEIKNSIQLQEFTPSFKESDLSILFEKYCDFSSEQAAALINILLLKNHTDEPWLKPLIKIDGQHVGLVLAPLIVPNLIRSIEHWMEVGGIDLNRRGDAFERYMRKELRKQIKGSPLSSTYLHPDSLHFGSEKEEIDLVWIIGKTILIGELKCMVYPSTPLEWNHIFNTVEKGAGQAVRKADYVAKNLNNFFSEISHSPLHKIADYNVQPLVISNIPAAAGYQYLGVPVADFYVLRNYIDGKLEQFVITDAEGKASPGKVIIFYNNEEEAGRNIRDYLLNPPAVEILKKALKESLLDLPKIDKSEVKKAIKILGVDHQSVMDQSPKSFSTVNVVI